MGVKSALIIPQKKTKVKETILKKAKKPINEAVIQPVNETEQEEPAAE